MVSNWIYFVAMKAKCTVCYWNFTGAQVVYWSLYILAEEYQSATGICCENMWK